MKQPRTGWSKCEKLLYSHVGENAMIYFSQTLRNISVGFNWTLHRGFEKSSD